MLNLQKKFNKKSKKSKKLSRDNKDNKDNNTSYGGFPPLSIKNNKLLINIEDQKNIRTMTNKSNNLNITEILKQKLKNIEDNFI
jgi:hypothetical protein